MFEDDCPDQHLASYTFHGMLRLFLYREITGQSYRTLAWYQELVDVLGLERIPNESVLSRTWHNHDDSVRECIVTAAHYVVR